MFKVFFYETATELSKRLSYIDVIHSDNAAYVSSYSIFLL